MVSWHTGDSGLRLHEKRHGSSHINGASLEPGSSSGQPAYHQRAKSRTTLSVLKPTFAELGNVATLARSVVAAVVLGWVSGVLLGTEREPWGIAVGCVAALCAAQAFNRMDPLTAASVGVPAWERVRSEIERARRHNRSLVVARLPLVPSEGENARALADMAESVLRVGDTAWGENRSVLLLLVETDGQAAEAVIDRVARTLDGRVKERIVATFPEEVLTLGALVDRLYPSRRMRALRGGVSQSAGAPVPVVTVDTERQVLSVDAERESTA